MTKNTPFQDDLEVQYASMPRGMWNLICTKRDLTMYVKHGMKPNRHWKVTDVKKYFGIKGTGEKLLANFMKVFDEYMPQEGETDDNSRNN